MAGLVLSLREGAHLADEGEGQVVIRAEGAGVRLRRVTPAVRDALHRVGNGGAFEDELAERIEQRDGTSGLRSFYYYLQHLSRRGLLMRSAFGCDGPLATLVPASDSFYYQGRRTTPDQSYVLSRFAYLHTLDGQMLLESPLAHAHVRLHDARTAALLHALARPRRASELAESAPALSSDDALLVLDLLLNADMIGDADEAGFSATDHSTALRTWEFHDLLFHARSRKGRHMNPVGGTFRLAGRLAPPPALKPVPAREDVGLHRPDLDQLVQHDPPFAHVVESRRSIREYAERPITARQLGEFLYRVGRVKECAETELATPHGPVRLELASRPYPAGGALYELELYVAVNACDGLAPGLYYHEPLAHRLARLSGRTEALEQLLRDAAAASGIPADRLQLLLVVAARFPRVAWKYASMAYALILKNVGVLYQTMYLAATAMNLAPCAIGCGDSDLFARAAGTDYYAESSVGEFLLGSKL